MQQNPTKITSTDGKFTLSGNMPKGYYLTMETFGLPDTAPGEVTGGPYGVFTKTAGKINATVSLGGKIYVYNTKWAILDGFEIFSNKTRNGKEALKKILGFDINLDHLEDNLNLCTDLYRLCFAYEHVTLMPDYNIKLKRFNPKDYKGRNIKLLNPFRRIGLHRIRRFLTMTKVF